MAFLQVYSLSDYSALEILHDLETTAYYVDKNSADYICTLARCIIKAVLRWIDMLNLCLEVGVPSAIMMYRGFSDTTF